MSELAQGRAGSIEPAQEELGGDAKPALAKQAKSRAWVRGALFGLALLVVLALVVGLIMKRLMGASQAPAEAKGPEVASTGGAALRLQREPTGALPPLAPSSAAAAVGRYSASRQVPEVSDAGGAQPVPVARGSTAGRRDAVAPQPHLAVDAPVVAPGRGQVARQGPAAASGDGGEQDVGSSIASSLAKLEAERTRLQTMLDATTGAKTQPTAMPRGLAGLGAAMGNSAGEAGRPADAGAADPGALLGGTMEQSKTPRAGARMLLNRTLTIPKGTFVTCALKTRIVTATSGFIGCQVQRDVYGGDSKVVLLERGTHLDGEYRIVMVRPGLTRIPVVWTRALTPHGVTVDLESPGTGALGESGIGGHVDNRWGERVGAAMLLSLIGDTVRIAVDNTTHQDSGSNSVVFSGTASQGNKMAEQVLNSTINIPPLLYANQGAMVAVYVARDLDFSGVYKLQPM